jgi:hypothetical protein
VFKVLVNVHLNDRVGFAFLELLVLFNELPDYILV